LAGIILRWRTRIFLPFIRTRRAFDLRSAFQQEETAITNAIGGACYLCRLFARQYRPDNERAKQARDYAYSNRKMIHEAFDRGVVKADNALRVGFETAVPAPPCFTSRSPSANHLMAHYVVGLGLVILHYYTKCNTEGCGRSRALRPGKHKQSFL
jgi:hypothetical protein